MPWICCGSSVVAQPHKKQLQRTVIDKVPRQIGQRAAAELRRYAATPCVSRSKQ